MVTNTQINRWTDELWESLYAHDGEESTHTLSDGREIKLEIIADGYDRFHEDDFYGRVQPSENNCYTGYSKRPNGFNGAARKFDTRDGRYWWQPPADLVNDPDNCRKLFETVRDYYNGDWWYVGVVVSFLRGFPCACGAKTHKEDSTASVWGIESNAGDDYFKETISELIREAYAS